MEKRKIIEIYATEDLENMEVNFEVERLEDSKISKIVLPPINLVKSITEPTIFDIIDSN